MTNKRRFWQREKERNRSVALCLEKAVYFLFWIKKKLTAVWVTLIFFLKDARVSVKACEGLMLCASLPEHSAAKALIHQTHFCQSLATTLCHSYEKLPLMVLPEHIMTSEAKWGWVRLFFPFLWILKNSLVMYRPCAFVLYQICLDTDFLSLLHHPPPCISLQKEVES